MKISVLFVRFLVAGLGLMASLQTSAIILTNDTYIGVTNSFFEGAPVVVSNCVVTIDGTHFFDGIAVQKGGVLTHSVTTNFVIVGTNTVGLNLTISHDLSIESGGAIEVSAKGNPSGLGIGAGSRRSTNSPYSYIAGAGGGYGGFGGLSSTFAPGGTCYGSITSPADVGS